MPTNIKAVVSSGTNLRAKTVAIAPRQSLLDLTDVNPSGLADGAVLLYRHGDFSRRRFDLETPTCRPDRQVDRPHRGVVCLSVAVDRVVVGQAHVGHLLGLGCAADINAGAAVFVSGIYGADRSLR